jgi:hypothetical protein
MAALFHSSHAWVKSRHTGLSQCRVCGQLLYSAWLTSDCPGEPVAYTTISARMRSGEDFLDGEWRKPFQSLRKLSNVKRLLKPKVVSNGEEK